MHKLIFLISKAYLFFNIYLKKWGKTQLIFFFKGNKTPKSEVPKENGVESSSSKSEDIQVSSVAGKIHFKTDLKL